MKRASLRKLSEVIEKMMNSKGLTPKQLAQKSGISYSSLTPILSGSRDFGISKLIAMANALGCTPDDLLSGLYTTNTSSTHPNPSDSPKILAAFISIIAVTYCVIYEVDSKETNTSVLQFPLRLGQEPDEFIDHLAVSLQNLSKKFKKPVNNKDIAVFVSVQQYSRAGNRKKIQHKGDHLFAKFIMEPDAITNHRALLNDKNGICISINDGDVITYSNDKGQNISKLQGYGFPISDVAGNYWIGSEAIKHAINVKEHTETASLLSDKILALFNDDIDLLSECTMKNPGIYYSKASSIVKELLHRKQRSYSIIENSTTLLMEKIKFIDKLTKTKLPILITGDLAYIYESFFPNDRLLRLTTRHSTILLDYGIKLLDKETTKTTT